MVSWPSACYADTDHGKISLQGQRSLSGGDYGYGRLPSGSHYFRRQFCGHADSQKGISSGLCQL